MPGEHKSLTLQSNGSGHFGMRYSLCNPLCKHVVPRSIPSSSAAVHRSHTHTDRHKPPTTQTHMYTDTQIQKYTHIPHTDTQMNTQAHTWTHTHISNGNITCRNAHSVNCNLTCHFIYGKYTRTSLTQPSEGQLMPVSTLK